MYSECVTGGGGLPLTQCHTHRDISVLDHFREFIKTYLAITVFVGFHDGFINDLCDRRRIHQ